MSNNEAKRKNIVLVGMMGCGKTSVSAELQKFFPDFALVEMDSELEERAGMKITEIFQIHGEEHFRIAEKQLVTEISTESSQIISTGGGVFLSEENRALLNENSLTVYLSADSETIYERVKTDNSRPLLKSDDPKARISELLAERTPYYKLAHTEISTVGKNVRAIAEEILEKYKNHGN